MQIAVTGHRPNKLDHNYSYNSTLSHSIIGKMIDIVSQYPPKELTMISGMALGVDTMWGLVAQQLGIKLIVAIPFTNQHTLWSQLSKSIYFQLLGYAAEIINVSQSDDYSAAKMQQRNIYMVNHSDKLVAVFNGDKSGGTYNCIQYARSVNREIIYIPV